MYKNKLLIVKNVKTPDFQEYIMQEFAMLGITVQDVMIDKNFEEGTSKYLFYLKFPDSLCEDSILSKINYSASLRNNGLEFN